MIEDILAFLKFLIPIIPVALAALLPLVINLKKKKRHLQLGLPVIALVYGAVFLWLVDNISAVLMNGIYWVLDWAADFIAKYEWLHFINNINWAYGILYVTNLVMLLLFVLIKALLLPILSVGKPEKNKILAFFTGLFYTYDEDDKKWYLKDTLGHAKRVMLAIHVGVLVFSSLLFAGTCYLISKELLSVPFYPMFGILIFGECYFFLCGLPKGGEEQEEEGEAPEDEEKKLDYSALKEVYEKLFGDRLAGIAELPPTSDKRSAVDQLLQRYYAEAEETDSQEAQLFYRYFSQLAQRDEELDDGLISAARNIMDGKNVLFNTPFYEDTTEYIFLPVLRHLMRNKKLLIIVGRTGADKSVDTWLRKGLFHINSFENLWKIDTLAECDELTKIAILPMKDIYNQKLLTEKEKFLTETGMVMIMDPARLLGTMQVGLSNVVSYLRRGEAPQFIAYDRNCDGLVDSLSHVLGSSIEEVTATVVGSATSTAMIWEADGQNLHNRLGLDTARYLGVGTELGAVALTGSVPAVDWLAYEKFPATDIRWIVSQYYGPLCKVMGIPVSQSTLEERLRISPDIWSMPQQKDCFVVAEDEYHNPYEVIRQFSTRAREQAFVHVLSPNYLLRDYMCENAEIFSYDPKAIPSFAADYQRVRNNTVYRITMRLINGEITEEEIKAALDLIGIDSANVYEDLVSLITECFIPDDTQSQAFADGIINVRHELVVDRKTRRPERRRVYSITSATFIERFLSQLQVVHYVAEDEQDKNLYINSILYGHIYQQFLPGTFTVLDGKYYEVVSITRRSGMVVRRAADHVTRRRYYRQLRSYRVTGFHYNDEIASSVAFGNVCLEHGEAAVTVSTAGYLEQADFGDLKNATRVTISGIPERQYPHKNVLRFKLAGADAKTRFTVATMMNELFVTLFPEMHAYIVATTASDMLDRYEGYIPGLETDGADGDEYIYVIEDSLIDLGLLINVERYFKRIMEIVTDLLSWHTERLLAEEEEGGLLGEGDDPEGGEGGEEGVGGEEGADGEAGKKKSWWRRFVEWLRRLFRGKKKDAVPAEGEDGTAEAPGDEPGVPGDEPGVPGDEPGGLTEGPEVPGSEPGEEPGGKKPGFWGRLREKFRRKKGKKGETGADAPAEEPVPTDEPAEIGGVTDEPDAPGGITDVSDEGGAEPATVAGGDSTSFCYTHKGAPLFTYSHKEFSVIDDNEEAITGEDEESVEVDSENPGTPPVEPGKRRPYSERFFLLYGYAAVPEVLDLEGTLAYLTECGFAENYLKQARDNAKDTKLRWYNHRFEPGVHYCDFCGAKLEGTISVLKDGRERCADCKRTAITKVKDFRKLYKKTHARMEEVFGIRIDSKISIRITNAEEIAREGGYEFTPTPRFDGRALGFAQQMGGGKTRIVLENGAPLLETQKTLVHEMTHIWQYANMPCLFNPRNLPAIEGMAVWTEAQFLVCNGEEERAEAYVRGRCMEDSEYGQGMREYIQKFPLRKGSTCKNGTPFTMPGKNPLNG